MAFVGFESEDALLTAPYPIAHAGGDGRRFY